MSDNFNPVDYDLHIPSSKEMLLDEVSSLRYATSQKIDEVTRNQQRLINFTKSETERCATESLKNRKRSDRQFWLSFSVAVLGVLVGIAGVVVGLLF